MVVIRDVVEPVSESPSRIVGDDAIAEALRAFVCALGPAAADVRVEFSAGVATLSGTVPSAEQQQAIEDLIAAHDRLDRVVSELRLTGAGVAAHQD